MFLSQFLSYCIMAITDAKLKGEPANFYSILYYYYG